MYVYIVQAACLLIEHKTNILQYTVQYNNSLITIQKENLVYWMIEDFHRSRI